MEFVIVIYPARRSVYIDDVLTGDTNQSLWTDAGTHKFDLGAPADYDPAFQEVAVAETTVLLPLKVVFTQKAK